MKMGVWWKGHHTVLEHPLEPPLVQSQIQIGLIVAYTKGNFLFQLDQTDTRGKTRYIGVIRDCLLLKIWRQKTRPTGGI